MTQDQESNFIDEMLSIDDRKVTGMNNDDTN
jgi:hypothetical protein